jgi:phytoene dehydrogenase-like protein
MADELRRNGVEIRTGAMVERILSEVVDGKRRVTGVVANGREIRCGAVLSNANIKNTVLRLAGAESFAPEFVKETEAVRISPSSCQVYFGIRKGETIPHIGDLIFTSEAKEFSSRELVDLHTTSRTFSIYYPETRPGSDRYTIVASLNAKYDDWAALSDAAYETEKRRLIDESLVALERFLPGIRAKIDWMEAATPRTIERYTQHWAGTSFGTKFEGLKVSMESPTSRRCTTPVRGSIIPGWLGTINYGVIVPTSRQRPHALASPPQAVARAAPTRATLPRHGAPQARTISRAKTRGDVAGGRLAGRLRRNLRDWADMCAGHRTSR